MNGSGEEAAPRPRTTSSFSSSILREVKLLSNFHARTLYYYTLSSYSSKLKRLAQAPTDAGRREESRVTIKEHQEVS